MLITDLAFIDDTGYHFADYPSFLAWIQDQYRSIYGADVYLEADSQDGQFLAVLAQAFYDTAALGASDFNSFSPATAQGVGLSRQVKLNGLTRRSPSHSTADLTVVGSNGTTITGGIAIDTLQQKWLLPTTTIPGSGSIIVTAVAELIGAVAAAASSINSIFTPTRGWQTVNNVAAATPGAPVETDAELRLRQSVSTANPSLTVMEGSTGAVANIAGVTKVIGYENDTAITDANGIPAHNVSILAVGGDSTAICNTIAFHKTPGVGTYGNTTITVYDTNGMPIAISFGRPATAEIGVEITISTFIGWSSDYLDLIKAAVAAAINVLPIGATVLVTSLYVPAYLVGTTAGTTFNISLLRIKKNAGGFGTSNIVLAYNDNPVCIAASDVTIIIT